MKKYTITLVITLLSLLVSRAASAQGFSGASVSPATQSACSSGTATLTVTGTSTCTATPAWTAQYQWESSPDGASWTTVSGATGTISAASPSGVFTPTVTATPPFSTIYYRAVVSSITSPCSGIGSTFTSSAASITVYADTPGTITGPLSICSAGSTTLSSAGGGVWSSANIAIAVVGSSTGIVSALSIGTTTITRTNGCGISTTTVTILPAPNAFSVTGGGGYCAGSGGVAVGLSGSETGVSYQLFLGSATVGSAIAGTGSSINFGLQTVAGIYTVHAINSTTGCTRNMTGSTTVAVNPVPTAYTVSVAGGGGYCSGPGNAIIVSGSNPGTAYQLYLGFTSVGSPVAGIGSAIEVGVPTALGTYSVIATNTTTGCQAAMLNTVSVFAGTPPDTIVGASSLCIGQSITWTDATPGGTWSSSSPVVASVSGSGVLTGMTPGTATITYTAAGCRATKVVTVLALPPSITGTPMVCVGATVALANSSPGGTWASAATFIATVTPTTGLVTGIAAGTTVITYTLASGCVTTRVVTVNPLPGPVFGSAVLCVGGLTTLAATPPGGVWSSSNPAVASVNSSGIVSGNSFGTTFITYTLSSGCNSTAIVTVNDVPAAVTSSLCVGASATAASGVAMVSGSSSIASISGGGTVVTGVSPGTAMITYSAAGAGCTSTAVLTVNAVGGITGFASVCQGATTSLSGTITGGTWTSGTTVIATIDASGVALGIAPGTAIISYTLPTGCRGTKVVTVLATPAAITGTLTACVGAATTLSSATGGGTWSSTATGTVSVGPSTGIVTGLAAGVAEVTYMIATGCTAKATVTINATAAIAGPPSICTGLTATFTDATIGGTWSSSNDLIASVGSSSGIVSAVSGGAVTITYSGIGCGAVTTVVSVVASTAAITGIFTVCNGATTSLASATGGGIWTSSDASIATVSSSGLVTGAGVGSATITYSAGTCGVVTAGVTVNTAPAAIFGTLAICEGTTTTLTDATGGGTWSIAPGAAATVSSSGVVTGIFAGTATVTYAIPSGCTATVMVTVNPLPALISGAPVTLCEGSTITMSASAFTFSSSSPHVTVTPAGVITGVTAGTATITVTLPATGCFNTFIITVYGVASAITGPSSACVGSSVTLANAASGGSWSSASSAVSVGTATGVVTALSPGVATISYTMPGGCFATTTLTIYATPAPITGSLSVCAGSSTPLTGTPAGGAWSSGTPAIATIGSGSGIITGIAPGTATVTYTLATGCYAVSVETVTLAPVAVTGPTSACVGTTVTLSSSPGGGVWSSSSAVVSIGSASGVVTAVSVGTATITYSISTGCMVTTTFTVYGTPTAIAGAFSVCEGLSVTLGDVTGGGTWVSSDASVATIGSSSGIVHGVAYGTTTITYTLGGGCYVTRTETVNPSPAAIGGPTSICTGTTATLTNTVSGGSWSTTSSVATIGSATGIITGTATGTATVLYTLSAGCVAAKFVTVSAAPSAITGPANICDPGLTTLSSISSGGTWSVGDPSVAFIDPSSGVISSVALGTTTITYTISGGCYTTRIETVYPSPAAITGTLLVCGGSSTSLADATPAGTWSSGTLPIATVTAGGVVTGVVAGTVNISYTLATGCAAVAPVTVNALPAAITGSPSMCLGGYSTLSSTPAGGTWSSSAASIADVGSSTGITLGVALGNAVITYTSPAGCIQTVSVSVIPGVPSITGTLTVCQSATTTLADVASGGIWSSGAISVATVSATGVVTGIAPGTAVISYTLGVCGTVYTTVTVGAQPAAFVVSSGGTFCSGGAGVAITLSGSQTGVTYRMYYGTTVVAGPISGTGAALTMGTMGTGNYSITATNALGCTTAMTGIATVNALLIPSLVSVTGGGGWCTGSGGVPVRLSTSFIGVTYQVYRGAIPVGSPVTGTGDTLTLGSYSVAGTYSVVATKVTTGCTSNMSGSAVITIVAGCTGTPVAGVSYVPARVCIGNTTTLSAWGYSTGCGLTYRWQYSVDSVTWSDISGAVTPTFIFPVTVSGYYRWAVRCLGSGITSYTAGHHLDATYLIAYHFGYGPDTACGAAHFYVSTCGGTATSVTTYFGDGSSATSSLVSGYGYIIFAHAYTLPGTYSVKHVLYHSGIATDSVTFSYEEHYCRRLAVKFYKDDNTNCLFDGTDYYNRVPVTTAIDSNGVPVDTIVATSGFYYGATGPAGTVYRFHVLSIAGGLFVACPASAVLYDTISAATSYPVHYFGLQCSTSGFDIIESVSNYPEPTMQQTYIFLDNPHCTAASPTVTMHFSPRYTFSYSYPAPVSVAGNTIVWNVSSISVATTYLPYIYASFTAPTVIVPGDTVHSDYLATPLAGDLNTANNYVALVNTVIGAYDPNEIAVTPTGFVLPCTELQYTVDFENTGNDTAHNIYVLDTLSDYLDPNSIAVAYGSNTMNIAIINDGGYNIAKFDFPDINLLDSSHRDLCHGRFIYTIKARSTMPIGTSIPARVGIYFDNNPVVLTNTVANTIGIAPVSGPSAICTGFAGSFSDATEGGTWITGDPLVATTSPSGTVSGHRVGTTVVSYTASNSCGSLTATKPVTVDSSYIPVVSLAAHPGTYITSGQHDTLVAAVAGAGPSPAYRWLVNGVVKAGATTSTFISSTLADGDSVVCEVMGSGDCGLPSYNFVIMHVSTDVGAIQNNGITLYPNPNKGVFTLAGKAAGDTRMEIRNMLGQVVRTEILHAVNGSINTQVQLDNTLPDGMYTIILHSGNEQKVLHFVLAQ